jgi:hypothetical protein
VRLLVQIRTRQTPTWWLALVAAPATPDRLLALRRQADTERPVPLLHPSDTGWSSTIPISSANGSGGPEGPGAKRAILREYA